MMTDRTNEQWLAELRGPEQPQALADLRELLLRGLRAALGNRIQRDLDHVMEDFVQDGIIKIMDNLDTFRGESRFTTWAQKIAVNAAFTELRRRRWQDISLQQMVEDQEGNEFTPAILTDPDATPEEQSTRRAMMTFVQKMIDEELTERQRQAIQAVIFNETPMEEVARRMNTNRNALYKLIFDARQNLHRKMAENGFTPQDVLAVFD
ncbi:MAG TPA: sigma-70 family RNA polymerase sigma factor [Anaerolineales bacterium]|nr:sigma-70 family RNA polymerase sigma factor [Anaerolineales bacterium]